MSWQKKSSVLMVLYSNGEAGLKSKQISNFMLGYMPRKEIKVVEPSRVWSSDWGN